MIELGKTKRKNTNMVYMTMINLIFLLTFFFVVTGTVEKKDGDLVKLPESLSDKKFEASEDTITILDGGSLLIGGKTVSTEDLSTVLQGFFGKNPDRPIFVNADANLKAQEFFKIVKIIAASGGSDVKLITRNVK